MSEKQDEKWLDDLDAQIEHASPDFLKATLEHTTKMLDHVYAANDSISQKARWAIGTIMVVMVVLLRQTVAEAKLVLADHSQTLPWVLYGIVLAGLAVCLFIFFSITWVERHYHSGIMPKDIRWKATIQDAMEQADFKGKTGTNGIDLAYFVSATMPEYQRRIKEGRTLNDKIAFRFNLALIILVMSLAWWMTCYIWLN